MESRNLAKKQATYRVVYILNYASRCVTEQRSTQTTYLLIRITSLLAHKKLSMKNILQVKKKEISKLISRWEVGIEYISSQLTFTDTISSLKKLEGCVFSFNLLHILAYFMDYLFVKNSSSRNTQEKQVNWKQIKWNYPLYFIF